MMSVPVVKQAIPSSGGGTTGPVGGGPGAGPPSSQSPGKMVTTGPQAGANILQKGATPGNPMVGTMGGHSVAQAGGIAQTLQNSSLLKQVPPTASSMPISMVANHTASAQSMVHQSLSGVSGAGTLAPLSLVQEHRAPSTGVPQPTPPAAHNHPTPPMPTQRGSAPPAHSTAPPSAHPPQSGPSTNPLIGGGIDKPKELIVVVKPTSNGVQVQKAGEASGAQQQARKVSDGPVSLVVNHSTPEAPGNVGMSNATPQQSQQTHSLAAPVAAASSVQISAVKADAAVANHATSQPPKGGLASTAAVTNKVSPAPSPVKDKAPSTAMKLVPATAAPKAPAPSATETNEVPAKSATPVLSSAPQSTTSQATTVKAPATPAGASAAKPSMPVTPAATAAMPAATTAPSESAASSSQGTGASEASIATTASPAKPVATPTSSSTTEGTKVNNTTSAPAKTATENQNTDAKATTPTESAESATPTGTASADKEGKANTPPSATPSRGSKRKRAEVKPPAPTLGSSQAAAIAAASRTPSSKSKSQSDIGSVKKEGGGEEDDDEERKPKRVRIRTQPYQSPLPELAYLPKFTRTPTSKAQEDKLILFYKNEFLAVRNAEGGFYVCQTMQNIYKHSARIRIRWLSQDTTAPKTDEEKEQSTNDGEVYSPDFYDLTDFDCILTNLNLDRLERGKYRLPHVELERTQSILKRALDAEKGLGQKTPLTEEHPDGLDLSLYRDESQLKKRRSPRRKGGPGKAKNVEGGKGKQEDEEDDKESSSSSSSSSEDEAVEAEESPMKKTKREKRAPQQPAQQLAQPPKEPLTPATPRARGGREAGKRKAGAESSEGKAKATPSAVASKKRNNSSTPTRKRRSEAPTVAAPATPATPPARATPARATRSPKSAPAPSRKERSRVKEARKKPGKKA